MHARRRILPAACLVGCLLAATAFGSGGLAQEAAEPSADAALVRPLIGETTALVVKVEPARLALPELSDLLERTAELEEIYPQIEAAYQQAAQAAAAALETLRAATADQPIYATIGLPYSLTDWPVFVFLEQTPQVDRERLQEHLVAAGLESELVAREGLVIAQPGLPGEVAAAVDALTPSPREELVDAFAAVAEYPIQVLLLPPDYVRRTVVELMPQLPPQVGGGPSEVLTEGLLWAALGLDPAELRAELVVHSASETAARRLAEYLPTMLRSALDELPDREDPVTGEVRELLLSLVDPEVEGQRVIVRLGEEEFVRGINHFVTITVPAIQERIRRQTDTYKFREILLGVHIYHDSHGVLPPRDVLLHAVRPPRPARDEEGRPWVSWRVYLLPYFGEEGMKLYHAFRLDEPWDSPHNKPLIEQMPDMYRAQAADVPAGHTTFLAPVGEDTVFGGPKAIGFSDIRDGMSFTVMLVEVKPELAVPWTAPEDYAFDPDDPGAGLRLRDDGCFLAGFADGSVRTIPGDIDAEMLLRLFQKSSGKPIDPAALR